MECTVKLVIASVSTQVTVPVADALFDPHRTTSVNNVGLQAIAERLDAGNAVLHPRRSVDGIPLTEIEADNVDSLTTQFEASQSLRPDEYRQYREPIGVRFIGHTTRNGKEPYGRVEPFSSRL